MKGLASRVGENWQILAQRAHARKQLESLGQPVLVLERRSGRAWLGGQEVKLGDPQFRLLLAVTESRGDVVDYRHLQELTEDYHKTKSLLLKSLNAAARSAARRDSPCVDLMKLVENLIQLKRGVGYRLGVPPDQIAIR